MRLKSGRKFNNLLDCGLNLVIVSMLTGLFAGTVITLYNVCMHFGEEYSRNLYSLIRDNPAFVPLLFAGLAAGAFVIGIFVRLVPMIRGSGIPQIEGAARGVVRFKWYVTMCSMFAASLACAFMGLPAGAEGPSLEIGGCCGSASGTLLKRNFMVKRLQIAAGSSAGLAVAFNAPVTGMVFALEEAFRSFSPQVFISSAVSVVTALFVRSAFARIGALEITSGFAFDGFSFSGGSSFAFCGYALLAAAVAGLCGVGFYYLVFLLKKLFSKITFAHGAGKYIAPFFAAGAFGLITVYAMGGGANFISSLATGGTGDIRIERIFGIGLVATLAVVTLLRFVSAALSMGCSVPCGVFVPMLATGAGMGALLSVLFVKTGMDPAYTDYLIIITMSAFFTSVVRAPITGIVLIFELTGEFTGFLPALIGVGVGYLVSFLFKLQPIYEKCLDLYVSEEKLYDKVKKVGFRVSVLKDSRAVGAAIRSIIWPANGLVVGLVRADGSTLVPDGETILSEGDEITFECDTDNTDELYEYLYDICGKPPEKSGENAEEADGSIR